MKRFPKFSFLFIFIFLQLWLLLLGIPDKALAALVFSARLPTLAADTALESGSSLNLILKIYDDEFAGRLLYEELQEVTGERINATFEKGEVRHREQSFGPRAEQLWVEIELDGEILSPRLSLAALGSTTELSGEDLRLTEAELRTAGEGILTIDNDGVKLGNLLDMGDQAIRLGGVERSTWTSEGSGSGDITGVVAGTGLAGGGDVGTVTINAAIPFKLDGTISGQGIIQGENSSGYGVLGKSSGAADDYSGGCGVFGLGEAASGTNYGVVGRSYSSEGCGVFGNASAESGITRGVYGRSYSPEGYGVYGYASAISGINYGVYGISSSPDGYAGHFVGRVRIMAHEPTLILEDESLDGERCRIRFLNNSGIFDSDDRANQNYGFYSIFSGSRSNDAVLAVYGKSDGSWGKCTAITHDGSDGEIYTDTGDLKLSPASNHVVVNGNFNLPDTTSDTGIIFSGVYTLMHTYGLANFFAGRGAGNLTMGGEYNTACGSMALSANTSGYNNTACGRDTLKSNTEADDNTALGAGALQDNNTGSENTACGADALGNNTTGYSNTASGRFALFCNIDGHSNTANGRGSLENNTSGYYNTACGHEALSSNSTGYYNTAVGRHAGLGCQTGHNNTFIGFAAYTTKNNIENATAVGHGAEVSLSNSVRIGDEDVIQIGGQVAWSNLSDRRHKKDINDIGFGLDFIKALRPVEFRLLSGNDRLDFGFIAQEVESLVGDDYNLLGIGGDPERTLSLRYTDFIAPLVKAVQEQQEIINHQQDELDELRSQLAIMRTLIQEVKDSQSQAR